MGLSINNCCVHYYNNYCLLFPRFAFSGNAFVAASEIRRRAVLVSTETQYRTKLLQNLTAVLGREESH